MGEFCSSMSPVSRLPPLATLRAFAVAGRRQSLRDAAAELGVGESAIKVAVHRLREHFRACLRAEVADAMLGASPLAVASAEVSALQDKAEEAHRERP
jgi:hypothetical protein